MASKRTTEQSSQAVNLRMHEDVCALINRAAKSHGKTRSSFIIDASRKAAEDALLDQILVSVDAESYKYYLSVLDQPPSGDGFKRLMNAPKFW